MAGQVGLQRIVELVAGRWQVRWDQVGSIATEFTLGGGSSVILTGLSPAIAKALVTLGVDLTKLNTVGDLLGGVEEADRLLGYRVSQIEA